MKPSPKLILASGSPRRKELLKEAGFEFRVEKIPFDESFSTEIEASELAEYLAKEKNRASDTLVKDNTVLTADTVVVSRSSVLGKPKDKAEAAEMLLDLSGVTHQVFTGVCIRNTSKEVSFSCLTEVKVRDLGESEIQFYIEKYQPFDKAGAYGIQEWFGLACIEWIKGSYTNVVGLPVSQVYSSLTSEFDIKPKGN